MSRVGQRIEQVGSLDEALEYCLANLNSGFYPDDLFQEGDRDLSSSNFYLSYNSRKPIGVIELSEDDYFEYEGNKSTQILNVYPLIPSNSREEVLEFVGEDFPREYSEDLLTSGDYLNKGEISSGLPQSPKILERLLEDGIFLCEKEILIIQSSDMLKHLLLNNALKKSNYFNLDSRFSKKFIFPDEDIPDTEIEFYNWVWENSFYMSRLN